MIEQPRLDQLQGAFSSPYELVVAVAQRARQLNEESIDTVSTTYPLTAALGEARDGRLQIERPGS